MRTGNISSETQFQVSLQDLLGTAFSKDPESHIGVICFAFGRALKRIYDMAQMLSLQTTPLTMSQNLQNMEKFLKISPTPDETPGQRRARLQRLFSRFSNKPTDSNVDDVLSELLGTLFISKTHILANTEIDADGYTVGRMPGGLINGFVKIHDGQYWTSPLSYIPIRVWNPRTHLGQEQFTEAQFREKANSFVGEFDSYVPANVDFGWYRHVEMHPGTINYTSGESEIYGVGTEWVSANNPLIPGQIMECISDDDKRIDFIVDEAVDDETVRIVNPKSTTITNGKYRRNGIFLDTPGVCDNAAFRI